MSANHYRHPTMGRFTRDKHGDYFRRVPIGGRRILLLLNCAYEGPDRLPENLAACAKIAARVYDRLDRLVERAAALASSRCLAFVNRIRAEERKSPLTSAGFIKRMRLLDVCVDPGSGMVTFGANSYEDEHGLVRVRFGPRGGLREAYIE